MIKIEDLELKIAKFLRSGVVFAGIVIALGWLLTFKGGPDTLTSLKNYSQLDFFTQLELAFMDQDLGKLISYLGLMFLISLPLIRVILSIYLFVKQKEHLMAVLGLTVLIGLLVSFSCGIEF